MGLGGPAVATNQRRDVNSGPPGPPFLPTSADNGLSVDAVSGRIVLGQDVGATGDPAMYLSDRELPNAGFSTRMVGTGKLIISQTPAINTGQSIQADAGIRIGNGFGGTIELDSAPAATLSLISNGGSIDSQGNNAQLTVGPENIIGIMQNTGFFEVATFGGVPRLFIPQSGNVLVGSVIDNSRKLQVNGSVSFSDAAALLHAVVAMTDGAGASLGTLTNAPSAGNPTKWIGFDDNGVTRFIPTW